MRLSKIGDFSRLNLLLSSVCVLLLTMSYETRYSNIGLISAIIGFTMFSKKKLLFDLRTNKAFLLLLVNVFIFYIGFVLFENQSYENFERQLGKPILLVLISILIFPLKEIEKIRLCRFLSGSYVISIFIGLGLIFFHSYFLKEGFNNPIVYNEVTVGIGSIHPAYFSLFCCLSFFFILDLVIKTSNIRFKTIYFFGLVILFASIIMLNARTPIIAFFVSLLIYIILVIKLEGNLRLLVFVFILIFFSFVLLFWLLNKQQQNLFFDRVWNNFYLSLSSRIDIWNCSWEVFKKNGSILFGVGSGNVQYFLNECYSQRFLTRPYFESFNVHNQHLLILVRNGVVGVIFWLLMLVYGYYKSIKNKNLVGVVFLTLFIVCGFTEVYLDRIWGVLFFGVFYSLFIINDE